MQNDKEPRTKVKGQTPNHQLPAANDQQLTTRP